MLRIFFVYKGREEATSRIWNRPINVHMKDGWESNMLFYGTIAEQDTSAIHAH